MMQIGWFGEVLENSVKFVQWVDYNLIAQIAFSCLTREGFF
jgi:hypothetical protein